MSVAVIDSGGANLGSVLQALKRLGVEPSLTQSADVIRSADHVILPGVGTAHAAMDALTRAGLVDVIRELTQPVLGICLGLQLLFDRSEEGQGHTACLGVIPGDVVKLPESSTLRLPHMGWNQLQWIQQEPIAPSQNDNDWFYFVHSYAVAGEHPSAVAISQHGMSFAAVVRHNNFVACQFHPEKSAAAGEGLLAGFLSS